MALLALTATTACQPAPDRAGGGAEAAPEASFLTDDLVRVTLPAPPGADTDTLRAATDCAAAEAIVLRGAGFARHVRTILSEEGGIRRADAVYSVTRALPPGGNVIDAETVARACSERDDEG